MFTTSMQFSSGAFFEGDSILPSFNADGTAAALLAFQGSEQTVANLTRAVNHWHRPEFRLFGLIVRASKFPENERYVNQFVPVQGHAREKLEESNLHYDFERDRLVREVAFAQVWAEQESAKADEQAWRINECLAAWAFVRARRLETTREMAMVHWRDLDFFHSKPGRSNACVRVVFPLLLEEVDLAMEQLRPLAKGVHRREVLHSIFPVKVPA